MWQWQDMVTLNDASKLIPLSSYSVITHSIIIYTYDYIVLILFHFISLNTIGQSHTKTECI